MTANTVPSSANLLQSTIAFVKDQYPKVKYLITICTGAGIASRAGVLDGKCATSNKAAWATVLGWGPKVKWFVYPYLKNSAIHNCQIPNKILFLGKLHCV